MVCWFYYSFPKSLNLKLYFWKKNIINSINQKSTDGNQKPIHHLLQIFISSCPCLFFLHQSSVSVLQSLIPDIKVNQEAVVELHPEELQLSGDEENLDTSRGDQDKGLKIRRTVTQVRLCDSNSVPTKYGIKFWSFPGLKTYGKMDS